MAFGAIFICNKIKDSATVAAVLDLIVVREVYEHAAGDLQMAFAAYTVAHDGHGFFAAIDPAIEQFEERFGYVFAKEYDFSFFFSGPTPVGCAVQFEFLQNQQVFNDVVHGIS